MAKKKVIALENVKLKAAVANEGPEGILFRVSGGFGKNIMATRVAKKIKEAHPDLPLHVQASYPDAFANLPFVDKFYPLGAPLTDFFDSHKNFDIVETEPYVDFGYRCEGKHLVDVWCDRLMLDPVSEKEHCGIIELSKQEKKSADMIVEQLKQQSGGRPLIGLQWIGGTSFYNPQEAQNPNRAMQVRELPVETAQKVCEAIVASERIPVVIGLPTEPRLKNAVTLLDGNGNAFPIRIVMAVIDRLDGLIAVDSFAQHAWAALGKEKAVVLWGATTPDRLGYKNNINILPPPNCCRYGGGCQRPESHVGDWTGNGQPWQCQSDAACMDYNADEIVAKLGKAK